MSRKKTILVLDGETRSALAVVRSLGKAGYYCVVSSEKENSIASSSKFAAATILNPPKSMGLQTYQNWLEDTISTSDFDYLLPTTEFSLKAIYPNEILLKKLLALPFPEKESLDLSLDKYALTHLAHEVGIKVPKTLLLEKHYLDPRVGAIKITKRISLPLVLKARWSIQPNSESIEKAPLFYVNTIEELTSFINSESCKGYQYIAQEFIEGEGVGLFFLLKEGKLITSFSHRRLLEKPPEGGVSVLSESYHVPEAILNKSLDLLKNINWQGVAMVEFKFNPPEDFVLMEINPRFWGSLQLAIDSGVDFPALLLSNAPAEVPSWNSFKTKIRLRWELGLLDHVLIRLKRKFSGTLTSILLKNGLQFFSSHTKNEIFRLSDPKPFFFEFNEYVRLLIKK